MRDSDRNILASTCKAEYVQVLEARNYSQVCHKEPSPWHRHHGDSSLKPREVAKTIILSLGAPAGGPGAQGQAGLLGEFNGWRQRKGKQATPQPPWLRNNLPSAWPGPHCAAHAGLKLTVPLTRNAGLTATSTCPLSLEGEPRAARMLSMPTLPLSNTPAPRIFILCKPPSHNRGHLEDGLSLCLGLETT